MGDDISFFILKNLIPHKRRCLMLMTSGVRLIHVFLLMCFVEGYELNEFLRRCICSYSDLWTKRERERAFERRVETGR